MTDQPEKIKFRTTVSPDVQVRPSSRNGLTAVILFGIVASMTGLAFASDPLYRAFCKVTGYGGTTKVAAAPAKSNIIDQMITVRFDANVNKLLAWRFKPVQNTLKVRLGGQALAFFEATNISDKAIVGTATFNVAPFKAGEYFNKIECFCFTEQVLKPGQTVQMPVTFFVDPKIVKNRNTADLKSITLSYTFFASDDQSEAQRLQTSQIINKVSVSTLNSPEGGPNG